MSGTFFPPPRVSDPDMHQGTCVTHVPWCMPGSLTSGCLWSKWRGKRSWHSRRMRKPQFYVSDKKPIALSDKRNCSLFHAHYILVLDNTYCTHLHRNWPSINNHIIINHPMAFVEKIYRYFAMGQAQLWKISHASCGNSHYFFLWKIDP